MEPLQEINLVRLFEYGEITTGKDQTKEFRHYSYRVDPFTKHIIISINVANESIFEGDIKEKRVLIKSLIQYDLSNLQTVLAFKGIQNSEHCYIDDNDFTLHILLKGVTKLEANKEFQPALAKIKTIYSLTSNNLDEVATTLLNILHTKHSQYLIVKSSKDESSYNLIVKEECSFDLTEQLLDAFKQGALKVSNSEQGVVETKAEEFPNELLTAGQSLETSSVKLSLFMYSELPKRCQKVLTHLKQDKKDTSKQKKRVGFGNQEEEVEEKIELVNARNDENTVKKKQVKSFYQTAQNRLTAQTATPEDRGLWQVLVTSGLLADMDEIFPENLSITLENKSTIYAKLQEFFTREDKIKNINVMDYLFELLNERKNVLNLHKHDILDVFPLFKENTDSWQKLFWTIRYRAFELLKEDIQITEDGLAIDILTKYRGKALFREHIRNPTFFHIGDTNTVKAIDELIKQRRHNLVTKTNHLVRRKK